MHTDRARAFLRALTATLLAAPAAWGWSWSPADQYAPAGSLFVTRGTAQVFFGAQYAAPGAPTSLLSQYGVIQYRDNIESFRNYDLFFSPSLAVWKFLRYEPNGTTTARYIGGFHYDNCQDGFVTATDRVLMPAIGTTVATECGSPVTSVKTNYGCENSHFSNPFPIDNYQGAGSGSGVQPTIVSPTAWNGATQTLFSVTRPVPWIYYDGVLDPNSPRFLQDFLYCPDRNFIQQQVSAALNNLQLENQIRIYPDGTIMLTHLWTDLVNRPWRAGVTDGYWMAPDSAPNGTVYYYNATTNQYVQPFANGQNPSGIYLTSGNGWVGYFIDQIRPSFGMGFYYYPPGGIGIFPSNNWPSSPSVLHTDYSTGLRAFGQVFRQMFITLGTKEEMQAKLVTVKDYVFVFDTASPPPNGHQITIRPASAQDGDILLATGSVDTSTTFAKWGKLGGAGYVQVGIHSLPCGLTGSDVVQATLRMPRTDNIWTSDTTSLNLNMLLQHIAASSNASVTLPDGSSTPLGPLGTYRAPGAYVLDNGRSMDIDVTAALLTDLAAGRSTFSWRVEPQSVADGLSSQRYFPSVDNTDAAFPADIRGASLIITTNLPAATLKTGGCPDQNRDGDVDQSDFGVLQRCLSGSGIQPPAGCDNFDFDGDHDVDAQDLAVFLGCLSGADIRFNTACLP